MQNSVVNKCGTWTSFLHLRSFTSVWQAGQVSGYKCSMHLDSLTDPPACPNVGFCTPMTCPWLDETPLHLHRTWVSGDDLYYLPLMDGLSSTYAIVLQCRKRTLWEWDTMCYSECSQASVWKRIAFRGEGYEKKIICTESWKTITFRWTRHQEFQFINPLATTHDTC